MPQLWVQRRGASQEKMVDRYRYLPDACEIMFMIVRAASDPLLQLYKSKHKLCITAQPQNGRWVVDGRIWHGKLGALEMDEAPPAIVRHSGGEIASSLAEPWRSEGALPHSGPAGILSRKRAHPTPAETGLILQSECESAWGTTECRSCEACWVSACMTHS